MRISLKQRKKPRYQPNRCMFFRRPGGCRRGNDCRFEHFLMPKKPLLSSDTNNVIIPYSHECQDNSSSTYNSDLSSEFEKDTASSGQDKEFGHKIYDEIEQPLLLSSSKNMGAEDNKGEVDSSTVQQIDSLDLAVDSSPSEQSMFSDTTCNKSSNNSNHTKLKIPSSQHCVFFLKGYCKKGDYCKYKHPSPFYFGKKKEHEFDSCPICLAPVEELTLFGIQPNCSHVFCLNCIREWRSSNKDDDEDNAHNLLAKNCPLCRQKSPFIVPTSVVPKNRIQRLQMIKIFKKYTSAITCKYFESSSEVDRCCPFGKKCIYAHADEFGNPQKVRVDHQYFGTASRHPDDDDILWRSIVLNTQMFADLLS